MAKSYLISRVGEASTNQLQQSHMQRERKTGVCAPGCEAMKYTQSSQVLTVLTLWTSPLEGNEQLGVEQKVWLTQGSLILCHVFAKNDF